MIIRENLKTRDTISARPILRPFMSRAALAAFAGIRASGWFSCILKSHTLERVTVTSIKPFSVTPASVLLDRIHSRELIIDFLNMSQYVSTDVLSEAVKYLAALMPQGNTPPTVSENLQMELLLELEIPAHEVILTKSIVEAADFASKTSSFVEIVKSRKGEKHV